MATCSLRPPILEATLRPAPDDFEADALAALPVPLDLDAEALSVLPEWVAEVALLPLAVVIEPEPLAAWVTPPAKRLLELWYPSDWVGHRSLDW